MPSFHDLRREFQTTGAELLLTDLGVALTLMDVADTTRDPETARRNRDNALHARETVLRLLSELTLTEEKGQAIHGKLEELDTRLRAAGYAV